MNGATPRIWQVTADPYPWPLEDLGRDEAALVLIDMQRDFCDPDGYVASLGETSARLAAAVPVARRCLDAARENGLQVIHTRQGYRPDMAEMPEWKRLRGSTVGTPGPLGRILIRGEAGFEIVPELAPLDDEPIIDKTANGAFTGTDLDAILRARGIRVLAFAGVTIDVCVHTSLREANDRGYQCVMIEDACGALEQGLHDWSIRSVQIEGGVFGSVTTAQHFIEGLARP